MTPRFGKFIRTLRTERGMTQAALAAKLHVTDKAVSKWERDLSYPDISLFPRLAEELHVSVSDLINAADRGGEPEQLAEIYRVTHDIRTPIHIIIGCSDLVERYADDPEKRRRYLELIRVSGKYLLESCEQLRKETPYDNGKAAEALRNIYALTRTHRQKVREILNMTLPANAS